MANGTGKTGQLFNPFPGLRPFTQEESHLFFGREGQSKSVLSSLERNNFVAVIGASGSGKSSLIYCGVIPELQGKSEKNWLVVSSRPGNNPVRNLVNALGAALPDQVPEAEEERLVSGQDPIDAWLLNLVPGDKRLLLVIDQFEEIFRYRDTAAAEESQQQIARFVNLISEASSDRSGRISVVLTMRSDFIGECSVYQDLTDLINKSNYLIPQMTREDFRKAIEGPVRIGGASIEGALVEVLLDEVGNNTDQLPVLQHALMRTWDYWMLQDDPSKPIATADYEAIGRMEKALSDHANEAFDELNEEQRLLCENIFRTITEKGGDNRGVRRPSNIARVAAIAKSSAEDVIRVVEVFRKKGRTFLTPFQPAGLEEGTVIDISHESLMRIWDRLRLWVDEEAGSVQMYLKLSEASELYQEGTTGLWRPPDLQLALNWREKEQPTATWAVQYNPAFERAMVFLDTSDKEFRKEEENKIRLQKRRLRVTRMFSLILGGIAVIAMGLFLWTRDLQSQAEAEKNNAEEQRKRAEGEAERAMQQEQAAIVARDSAEIERQRAVDASVFAEEKRQEAVDASEEALRQKSIADRNARDARAAQSLAQRNADTANVQRQRAVDASELARRRRMLSIAKSMSVKSLQIDKNDDPDLKALLSYQAYLFNKQYGGPEHEADIYSGLYDARKALLGDDYNVYSGHSQAIKSILFIPGSEVFYTAGSDGQILVRSMSDDDKRYQVLDQKTNVIEALAISPDGKYLAVGTDAAGISLYDLTATSKEPALLMGHDGRIRDLEFSTVQDELYSIGLDRQILKWSVKGGQSSVVSTSDSRFRAIAVSPDGKKLAACNQSGNIMIIHLQEPGRIDTIKGPSVNPVHSVDFSNDGKYLAAGDERGNVRIILTGSWVQQYSLRGSTARIVSVEFSPKGNYLASSSYDGNVLMWDMSDLNNSPVVMEDNRGFVYSVGFSPDENYIISGSNSLVSRPVKSEKLTEGFCSMISRNFTREEWENYVGSDIEFNETCPLRITEKRTQ